MIKSAERSNKTIAAIGTLFIHGILLLILLLIVFKIPNPPFPQEESPGIEIDFGNNIEGMGNTENNGMNNSEVSSIQNTPSKSAPTQKQEDNSVITNENEQTISLSNNKKHKEIKNKTLTTIDVPAEPSPSNELMNALNKLKNKRTNSTGGDGNSGNAGNKGDPNGSIDGGGNGGGGLGNGKYNLKGRKILPRPEIIDDSQEEGRVVVEIIVDEQGKIIRATPGERGSTTTSAILYAKARQAALGAKFNPSPEGIKEQKGTITFVFTLD